MLSPCLVKEIERLLAAGYSQRQAGRLTGVSRTTINRIAAHRRPDFSEPLEMLCRTTAAKIVSAAGKVMGR